MGRKLKFRAWDNKNKVMYPVAIVDASGNIVGILGGQNFFEKGRASLLQFTGLLDKNGKEIFEGDILSSDIQIVTVVYTTESASFDLMTYSKGLMGMAGVNSILEIIGNIYENSDLLK